MEQTNPDQWEYQILVRMMCKHHIIFVSDPSARQFVEDMKLEYAPDLETALDRAYASRARTPHRGHPQRHLRHRGGVKTPTVEKYVRRNPYGNLQSSHP